MKLAVIGVGYVGLVSAACFAEMGNIVWCIDRDAEKIALLQRAILPIYEPGLEELVERNYEEQRLIFTTSLAEAASQVDLFFIAVGTPMGEDGSADLSHVLAVAEELGEVLQRNAVVVNKSTVPVGTAERVEAVIKAKLAERGMRFSVCVVSNPEFLKEGAAVEDFMRPDRIIIGTEDEAARELLAELYAPFNRNHQRILFMGAREAEMTKYAANAMLATKISFINEIAQMCERLGVDVEKVRVGIGSDTRIGYHFIYPGAGYGGSCFPKDVQALIRMAHAAGLEPIVLQAVEERNRLQKQTLFQKVIACFGKDLAQRTFGIWGLAFKPGTDDMREAPSLPLIEALLEHGAAVRAYDPVAMPNAEKLLAARGVAGKLSFVPHPYAAAEGADALILVTEWKPFRHPDFEALKRILKAPPLIIDGRNQYDPEQLMRLGIAYLGVGRQNRLAQQRFKKA